jgi:hypothetical protein
MRLHRNLVYTTIDALNAILAEYADKVAKDPKKRQTLQFRQEVCSRNHL